MTNEILMPELSPTMTSGTLSRWLVEIGERVSQGDIIAEIETDKVTVEFEADKGGIIGELLIAEGSEDIPVGTAILSFAKSGDEVLNTTPEKVQIIERVNSVDVNKLAAQSNSQNSNEKFMKNESADDRLVRDIKTNIRISPIARRMAVLAGLDVEKLSGSGEKGRISKQDIRNALGLKKPIFPTIASEQPHEYQFKAAYNLLPAYQEVTLTAMRKTVAERLAKSSQYIPHFHMSVDCDLESLLRLRKQINSDNENETKLTVNDFILKSVALALTQTPDANVMWDNDKILQFSDVDISVAVSIEGGLITPVIKGCNTKGLRQISSECSTLVEKAKAGRLAPTEFKGGTFTISNLGMFGIREFSSIINPPQAGILSVGAGEQRAVAVNGEIAIRTQITITLAMDHRCVDGVTGAKLINRIKEIIENPLELML